MKQWVKTTRHRVAIAATVLALGATITVLPAVIGQDPPGDEVLIVDADGDEFTARLPFTVSPVPTTSTVPPTTTTSAPTTTVSDSTTTTSDPGTTTSAPTSTTLPPTTTTTEPPAALGCQVRTSSGVFSAMFFDTEAGGVWASVDYCRETAHHPAPHSAGWFDGDRSGYRCFYTPGWYADQTTAGIVMRARWVRGPEYSGINDTRMAEGQRTYAGDPSAVDGREIGDCPDSDATYDAADCLSFAPTVVITHAGHVPHTLDVRDHDDRFCLLEVITEPFEDVGPGAKAPSCPQPKGSGYGCVPHTVHNRVVLGFVIERDGKMVIPTVGYYDSLRADITVTVR